MQAKCKLSSLTVIGIADGQITIVPRRQEPQVGMLVNVGTDEPPKKVCVL
jgi:hypothetical protein